ncbi:MAG: AsmA family protein [Candidatus Andeanibacterium colombiense]|uniref:AsmA family protein n=1 Tax=Candidatus Andeanibacterium colombiense TaxID=3121345 RepID=A0AAJ5X6W5_9SPHN|nr:MAG: AsmA family protein [Sphingomonadaceae bacterium]
MRKDVAKPMTSLAAIRQRTDAVAHAIWNPAWLQRRPKPLRMAIRAVGIVFLMLFLVWLVLFVTKGRFLKHPFENIAGSMLHREIRVGGDFNLYFAPIDIRFKAEKIRVSNPAWARSKDLFTADLVDSRIRTFPLIFGRQKIRWLTLRNSNVALEWDAKGERNSWTFSEEKGKPFHLPQIERGSVIDTTLAYRDPRLQLFADIAVETVKAQDSRFDSDIRFTGKGTMRAKPFTLSGSLLSPNETIAGGHNELAVHAQAARTTLDVSGTLPGATQIEGADLKLGVHGFDIADLFDFLGIAVPATRSYRLNSALTYDGNRWKFTRLKGVFGDSDIAGSLLIAMPNDRLKLTADLHTNTLDIIDAGPFIGYDPERLDTLGARGAIRQVGGHPRVLPDATLRIDAISRFDADVHYRVAKVRAQSFPLSDIDLTLGLDRSLLTLKPFKANLAGGRLTADIALNAREPAVLTSYDIRLSPTPMGKLLARFGVEESGTSGTLSARVQMRGMGDSLRQSLATSNGRIVVIFPQGTFWTRNIQLAELDIGTFVQKMFEKKLKDPVQVNCGLIGFTVRNGIAAADPILIDTKKNVILGYGGFSFKSEAIDMSVRADAKTFSLFSGQSPVGVEGYFAEPRIDPISGELVTRAGAGLGLGIFATPVAGLLAFIDPGDAKAAACGPVLAGARAAAQKTAKGKPREDVGAGTTAKSKDGRQPLDKADEQRKKFKG